MGRYQPNAVRNQCGVANCGQDFLSILRGGLMSENQDESELLTPAEVADLFRVDTKTVTRWADSGKISCVRTLGGHRRYLRDEIMRLLSQQTRA